MGLVKKASKHVQKDGYHYKTPNRWKYEFSGGVLTKTSFDSFGYEVGHETVLNTFLPLGQSVAGGTFIGTVDLGNDWLVVTTSGVFVADKSGVCVKAYTPSSSLGWPSFGVYDRYTHIHPIDVRKTDGGYRIVSPSNSTSQQLSIADITIY